MEYEIEGGESISMAVVRAVSVVEGRNPSSLRTLTEVVDPDALDALCAPHYGGVARTGGRVSFVYSGCHVTVDNGEYLTVQPLEDRLYDESDPGPTDGRVSR
ncbi:HalOD1 output domain-containing protein [Halogeometricum pallidum]|uniref:HalOD1 output domain-containing protein n=1 Tax=Halogeometricum pallidum TaxID=411361 RepID=UPI000677F984|nr:HalOD1 output domain-containing protein [Halogeometricum pallidum]